MSDWEFKFEDFWQPEFEALTSAIAKEATAAFVEAVVILANHRLKEERAKAPTVLGWNDNFAWYCQEREHKEFLSVPIHVGPAPYKARIEGITEIGEGK